MKKFLVILLLLTFTIPVIAKDNWVEVQTVEIPQGTPVYYRATDSGNIQYYFRINGNVITVSKTNAEKFVSGEVRLELVKWFNRDTQKYKYSVRRLVQNIDLSTVFN